MMSSKWWCVLVLFFTLAIPAHAEVYSAHTRASLVAQESAVPRQGLLWVGLRLSMEDDWHVYWRNPGDSGLAPSLTWTLPPGFEAGEVQWPYPHRINAGPLTSFGYEGEVLLAVPVRVPPGPLPATIDISLKASWLACRVDCVPGEALLSLALPVASANTPSIPSSDAPSFKEARAQWPVALESVQMRVRASAAEWVWDIRSPSIREGALFFFPFRDDIIANASVPRIVCKDGAYEVRVDRSRLSREAPLSLEGVWVHEGGWDAGGGAKALIVDVPVEASALPSPALSWWLACIFAFIGGIILNGMPCVLPVLSIKLLQLIHRESDRRRALEHAVLFTLGIMVSFWALAVLLGVLQAAGQAVGWGFQFQSPVFVLAVAALLFAFAMNLFGLFELPMLFAGAGPANGGRWGVFLSGVVMTLVATPCTAPFMGSALGFALGQPFLVGLLIFTFLGLGLAAPMVLLTLFPSLTRFVPRPGPWMIVFRQVLGFILLACVLWLLWVLGEQSGAPALLKALAVLFLISMALWLYGHGRRLAAGLFLAACVVLAAGAWIFRDAGQGVDWRPYDPVQVAASRAQGKAVFIDFTAAWCLTCQVNDHVVFRSPVIGQAFRERKVSAYKADWTSRDADITSALVALGRNSVPVYAYYAPGRQEARILAEILTPAMVLEVLEKP